MTKVAQADIHIRGKDKTKTAFNSVQGRLMRLKNAVSGVHGAMALALGAGFVVMAKEAAKTADEIRKMSGRIGIATNDLQELRYAFGLAGVEEETLNKGLLQFSKAIGEARAGTGTMITILKKTNQPLLDLLTGAENNTKALNIFMDALAGTRNQADRMALSSAALGRAGKLMTTAFENGIDVFNRTREEAHALGLVIEERLLRDAEEMNDKFSTVAKVLKIQFTAAILENAKALTGMAQSVLELLRTLRGVEGMTEKELVIPLARARDEVQRLQEAVDDLDDAFGPGELITRLWLIDDLQEAKEVLKELETASGKFVKETKGEKKPYVEDLSFPGDPKDSIGLIEKAGGPFNIDVIGKQHQALQAMLTQRQRANDALRLEVSGNKDLIPLLEFENKLRDKGTHLMDEEISRYRNEYKDLIDTQQKLNKQLEFQNNIVAAGERIFDRMGDGMLTAMQRGEDAMESFKNVAVAALFDVQREMFKLFIFAPLKKALFSGLGGLMSPFTTTVGESGLGSENIVESIVTPYGTDPGIYDDIPKFASGGYAHGGRMALVGERGPELFMPRVGGTVIPNDQLGGGGVNITLNFSTGVQSTVRAEVMGLMPVISENVKSAVAEARMRGGSFSAAMGV